MTYSEAMHHDIKSREPLPHHRHDFFAQMRDDPLLKAAFDNWVAGASVSFEDMLMQCCVVLSKQNQELHSRLVKMIQYEVPDMPKHLEP